MKKKRDGGQASASKQTSANFVEGVVGWKPVASLFLGMELFRTKKIIHQLSPVMPPWASPFAIDVVTLGSFVARKARVVNLSRQISPQNRYPSAHIDLLKRKLKIEVRKAEANEQIWGQREC